jgi:uncharacterized protein affecting Mg2+/Co2+ transport
MNTNKKQSNYHFSFTVSVDNSKEKVWETLIDVENWNVWDTELKSAKLNGEFKVGAKGILIPNKGPKLNFYISEIIPNETYTFKTKMPLGWLDIKRTLIVENDKILFTDDIQFTGILKHIFGLILGKGFIKVLPEVMQKFKKLAESK